MATQELGEIREVRLRDIWSNEAGSFTPWLAKNLKSLGDSLGLELERVEVEASSGAFSLDLLAKCTADDEMVVIENQLEQTDHNHLGQLITCAAEYEAGYVVWVVSRFRPEHRAAIEWLNGLAPEKVWFYAVEVRAIKIGDSLPAPDFRVVASPNEWESSRMQSPVEAPSPTALKCREFFSSLACELEKAGFGQSVPEGDNWHWFPHGKEHLWYWVGMDERAWVSLFIQGNHVFRQSLYQPLKAQQGEIDAELGAELGWYDGNTRFEPSVTLYMEGSVSIDDPPERLDEIRAWMLETLPKFRDVFNYRLEGILAGLDAE